jgi:phosphoglycerate dehydrogenase-like enzyme
MRVLYWPRIQLARRFIEAAAREFRDVELIVAETLDGVLAGIGTVEGIITPDIHGEDARRFILALKSDGHGVKWLHVVTAGREGLDAVGIPPGIAVSGPDGAIAPTVAEHGMAMMLALKRKLFDIRLNQFLEAWDRSPAETVTSIEDQQMLLIGYGAIGQAYARRAQAFGAIVTAVTRTPRPSPLADVRPLSDLEALLPAADIVVLCIALTEQTRHIIDCGRLAAMKPSAIIVNSSRGTMIDTDALVEALARGQIAGAAMDVTAPEPLPQGHPLWKFPNVFISPHLGGSGSLASQRRLAASVTQAIRQNLEG